MTPVVILILCIVLVLGYLENNTLNTQIGSLTERLEQLSKDYHDLSTEKETLILEVEKEKENSSKMLSMKASQATRTGQVVENLIPLLTELPYDPRNLHHLSQPIDFLYFNYDGANGPEIVFIECKSGKAKESKRQRLIKLAIQHGHVFYEQLRVDEHGIRTKRVTNEE
jgi:predicted Holliday junction resolvase-like endonuclease